MNTSLSILLFVLLLASACAGHTDSRRVMVQADSLLNVRPDSAWRLLQTIPASALTTRADRAYYALLLTQARDKNYVAQTDDSLIRTAVRYYDACGDAAL